MTIQQMIDTIRQALPPKGDIAVGQHFEANSGINADMLHTVLDTLSKFVSSPTSDELLKIAYEECVKTEGEYKKLESEFNRELLENDDVEIELEMAVARARNRFLTAQSNYNYVKAKIEKGETE